MTLRLTFLGTAGAVPTTERNVSGLHVNRDGDQLLFDAGEGTQRQLMRYGAGFAISDVFVTHLHGDHVYGLPGLLETWSFNDRSEPLVIHTPPGTRPDSLASRRRPAAGSPVPDGCPAACGGQGARTGR
jgi:ribonuclease Z